MPKLSAPNIVFFLSLKDEERLGFTQVSELLGCHSPQGRRLVRERRFFSPSEREALETELNAIAQLLEIRQESRAERAELLALFSRLRDIRGSLKRLQEGRLPDETELFEIKRNLQLLREICRFERVLTAASIRLAAIPEAEALLDPSGRNSQGFHIYSEYSEELALLRYRKKQLEQRVRLASATERDDLLTERSFVVAEEEEEALRVRRRLGEALRPYCETLGRRLEDIGLMDFRLAKAELAFLWKAGRPKLLREGEDAVLEEVFHPFVAEELAAHGADFTRQSLRVAAGTTVLSGANMGGKTVALRSVFLALSLLQLGFFPPARALSSPLYDFFSYHEESAGDSRRGLSSFGLEAVEIRQDLQRERRGRGLIIMDEPCRGTNPEEATAIIRALSRYYGKSKSALVLASHYRILPRAGIRFYRIRGLRPEGLREISPTRSEAQRDLIALSDEDLAAVRRIRELMDYRLEEVDGHHPVPSAAIRVAELMGMDERLVMMMREEWRAASRSEQAAINSPEANGAIEAEQGSLSGADSGSD